MNEFSIFHFDDSQDILDNVESYIISLNEDFKAFDIKINLTAFLENNAMLKSIRVKAPDLIILDMFDAQTNQAGENTLAHLHDQKLEIPVIIFTQGSKQGYNPHYDELAKLYPFLYQTPILKSIRNGWLKEVIRQYILKLSDTNLFTYDEDDIFLVGEIKSIGEQNINEMIFKIKSHFVTSENIILERLSSGFSGAAVFRMNTGGKISILKVSKEKNALQEELKNANRLYTKFPARLRIGINAIEFSNDQVVAILIEEVDSAEPLFPWLYRNSNAAEIIAFLNDLYLSNGLKTFYVKEQDNTLHKFRHIFSGFDKTRVSLVKKSIKSLSPILEELKKDIHFNSGEILNFIGGSSYLDIDSSNLTAAQFKKPLVLCHGDFHANNIMVQDKRPVIIDTGGMKYDFWCMDLCRLLVHIFILGTDQNNVRFFDYHTIKDDFIETKKLIDLKELPQRDGNIGYSTAINWLTSNAENIYGDLFSKWEFQLGLMKEFLQAAYRVDSIPPNKRAVALLAAQECLTAANMELKKTLKP